MRERVLKLPEWTAESKAELERQEKQVKDLEEQAALLRRQGNPNDEIEELIVVFKRQHTIVKRMIDRTEEKSGGV